MSPVVPLTQEGLVVRTRSVISTTSSGYQNLLPLPSPSCLVVGPLTLYSTTLDSTPFGSSGITPPFPVSYERSLTFSFNLNPLLSTRVTRSTSLSKHVSGPTRWTPIKSNPPPFPYFRDGSLASFCDITHDSHFGDGRSTSFTTSSTFNPTLLSGSSTVRRGEGS